MAVEFDPVEKEFLQQLQGHPEWQSILDKLAARRQDLRYRSGGDVKETVKIHQWIMQSGRSRENEEIVKLLSVGVRNG